MARVRYLFQSDKHSKDILILGLDFFYMRGRGVNEMSKLLNKYHEFYYVNLSTRGGGVKKVQKSVNVVCERPLKNHVPKWINGLLSVKS